MTQDNTNHQNAPQAPSLEQELLNRKVSEIEEKFIKLQEELGLVQIPIVNYTSYGVIPGNIWMEKGEYDRRQKLAQGGAQG